MSERNEKRDLAEENRLLRKQRDKLLEALQNLVSFARADGWEVYTTGRQLLLADARAAIEQVEKEQA